MARITSTLFSAFYFGLSSSFLLFSLSNVLPLHGEEMSWEDIIDSVFSHRTSTLALIHVVFCAVFITCTIIQKIVFGVIALDESKAIQESIVNFVFFQVVFIASLLDLDLAEVALWCCWFITVGGIKYVVLLARFRFNELFADDDNVQILNPVVDSSAERVVSSAESVIESSENISSSAESVDSSSSESDDSSSSESVLSSADNISADESVVSSSSQILNDQSAQADNSVSNVNIIPPAPLLQAPPLVNQRRATLYRNYLYILVLCAFCTLMVSFLIAGGAFLFYSAGVSPVFLFLFEANIVFIESVHMLAKYSLQIYWWNKNSDDWDERSTHFYFFDAVVDILTNSFTLMHYLHVWWLSGVWFSLVDFLLILNCRHAIVSLHRAYKSITSYRSAMITLQSRLANVTLEELQTLNDTCAICIVELDNPRSCKKLPCHHIFHSSCLRQWFKHKRICPNCRTPILPEDVVPPQSQAAEVQNLFPGVNERMMADLRQNPNNGFNVQQVYQFDSSNWISWFPSVSLQVSGHLGNGIGNANLNNINSQSASSSNTSSQANSLSASSIPSFSFASDVNNSSSIQSNIRYIRDMFPAEVVSSESIEADLARTGSVSETIDNILNGSISNSQNHNSESLQTSSTAVSSESKNVQTENSASSENKNIQADDTVSSSSTYSDSKPPSTSYSISSSNDLTDISSIREQTLRARRSYFENKN